MNPSHHLLQPALAGRALVLFGLRCSSRWTTAHLITLVVILTTMLAPLNSTMIAVALPQIMRDLAADVGQAGWLVTAYLIAMAALQPVAGKLGDRFGRRRLMLSGLLYFGLASVGAALATHWLLLLLFRVQQAIAGALAFPNGTALIREVIPAHQRGRYSGWIGSAAALAAASGPPLGGMLAGWLGWRALFSLNLLLVIPALWVGWQVLPRQRRATGSVRFDWVGSLLLSTLLSGTAWVLIAQRQVTTLLNLPLLLSVPALLLLAGLLFWYEASQHDALLPLTLFRARAFAAANGAIATSNLAMYVTLLALPLLLQQRGWASAQTGLVLATMSGMTALCSSWGGRLTDQWGRRWPAVIGLGSLAVGLLPLAMTGETIAPPLLIGGLALAGAGLGLSAAAIQTSALEAVGLAQTGMAAGVFSTSRYLGSILGSAAMTALLAAPAGFMGVFVMAAGAALLATLVSLALQDWPHTASDR